MLRFIHHLGDSTLYYLDQAGMMFMVLIKSLISLFRPPYRLGPIIGQIHFVGARSLAVIVVSGAFTGMVLTLQFHDSLSRFGDTDLLGSAVAIALLRELGPVMAALMVIARAGSAMCAEIGIMRTTEQVDALECMAIDPHKFLLAPKIIGTIIALPLLTGIFDVVGLWTGYFASVYIFDLNGGTYINSMYGGAQMSDVLMSLYKGLLFGLLISWIATSKGYLLHTDRQGAYGAEGVSRITTNAVVMSAIAVLFGDYLIGALML